MCGIVAAFNFSQPGLFKIDIELFIQLHKTATLRGEDGSGLFFVGDKASGAKRLTEKGEFAFTNWIKSAGTPFDLYASKTYIDLEWQLNLARFVVGHTRFATKGEVSIANSHPFSVDHITMVHNGIIDKIEGKDDFSKFDVDSHALCDALAKNPAREVFSQLRGAAAVIWYDAKENTINVFRNLQRSLSYVEIQNRIYIASEAGQLAWVLRRNNEGLNMNIIPFEPNIHYIYNHTSPVPRKVDYIKPHVFMDGNVIKHTDACMCYECKAKKQSAVNTKFDNSVVTLPVSMTKKEVRKSLPTDEHMGLKKGDIVIFNTMNLEYVNQEKNKAVVDGLFCGIASRVQSHLGLLADANIHAKLEGVTQDEVRKLYQHGFLQGRVAGLSLNTKDINDLKVYVTGAERVTAEQMRNYISNHKILLNNLAEYQLFINEQEKQELGIQVLH